MGLIPLAWTLSLRSARAIDRRWLWLAAAFAVSWLADWLSHFLLTPLVGPLYISVQSGIIVWTLAPPATAARFSVVLLGAVAMAMLSLVPTDPDILVHTIGWLGLLAVLTSVPLAPRLRWVLSLAFGLGWVAWLGYVLRPGWPSWLIYQGVRAASIAMFCRASFTPIWRVA